MNLRSLLTTNIVDVSPKGPS